MLAWKPVAVAAALLVISSAAAFARPALVVADVNLRAGPTTASPSYGVIPGGSTVDVGPCGNGWCEVFAFGRRGFMASRYLDGGGPPPVMRVAPPPPMYGPPPPYAYGPPPPPPPYYYRRYPRHYYW